MSSIRIDRRRLVTGLALGSVFGPAMASGDKPLRIILPVGPGSGVDTIMRAAAPSLTKALGGQPVVLENAPGAGGITGTLQIVKAAPDGNTLGVVSNNHVFNPWVYKKMPIDTLADITPISVVGASPFVLVVNPNKVPAKNAVELQALLKSKPGVFNYASSGNGTVIQLASAMFIDAAGVEVSHIPYKGIGPMVADLIGGQVDMGAVSVPSVQGFLKSGALRAIGVMGKQRVASLPDLLTLAEQGFPSVDIAGWFAVVGPAKMAPAEVKRLNAAVVAAFATPETRDAMAKQQNIIDPMTPEASAAFFRSEQERYGKLVKKAHIVLD